MKLTIINSNSAGNCYILENDHEALLIECGVRMEKIKQAIGFNLSKISGCLLTHEHGDHSKAAFDVAAAGIPVYASQGTINALGKPHHRFNPVTPLKSFSVGSFEVYPFDVRHDAAEPICFQIRHDECGSVLFITDTFYVPYRFNSIHNILIEANYSNAILKRKMQLEETKRFLRNRIIQSHMDLDTAKGFLKANDLSQVNNIVLIHLSDSHSNAREFVEDVTALTGKTVYAADKGMVIDPFDKSPF